MSLHTNFPADYFPPGGDPAECESCHEVHEASTMLYDEQLLGFFCDGNCEQDYAEAAFERTYVMAEPTPPADCRDEHDETL